MENLQQLDIFIFILGFFCGACLGSFASALVWRVPRRIPWIYNVDEAGKFLGFVRSKCPQCHTTLQSIDLIPVISWTIQKGKCRYCDAKIGRIYPFLELLAGFIGGFIFVIFGLSMQAFLVLVTITFFVIFMCMGILQKYWSYQILIILIFLSLLFLIFTGF